MVSVPHVVVIDVSFLREYRQPPSGSGQYPLVFEQISAHGCSCPVHDRAQVFWLQLKVFKTSCEWLRGAGSIWPLTSPRDITSSACLRNSQMPGCRQAQDEACLASKSHVIQSDSRRWQSRPVKTVGSVGRPNPLPNGRGGKTRGIGVRPQSRSHQQAGSVILQLPLLIPDSDFPCGARWHTAAGWYPA